MIKYIMASTSNRNTRGNYHLEQSAYLNQRLYATNIEYNKSSNPYIAGDGLLQGRVSYDEFAHNGRDIESNLFGIGSTNLTLDSQPEFVPLRKTIQSLSIIEKIPLIMPDPVEIQKDQRPYLYSSQSYTPK